MKPGSLLVTSADSVVLNFRTQDMNGLIQDPVLASTLIPAANGAELTRVNLASATAFRAFFPLPFSLYFPFYSLYLYHLFSLSLPIYSASVVQLLEHLTATSYSAGAGSNPDSLRVYPLYMGKVTLAMLLWELVRNHHKLNGK